MNALFTAVLLAAEAFRSCKLYKAHVTGHKRNLSRTRFLDLVLHQPQVLSHNTFSAGGVPRPALLVMLRGSFSGSQFTSHTIPLQECVFWVLKAS